MDNKPFTDVPEPSYDWIDKHSVRSGNLERATGKDGGLWGIVPGLVYCGAVVLLSAVLGTEIARLFANQSILLQIIGWGCVVVVGMSAIASFYGKGAVYKSKRQQKLGMFFWVLELCALTIGLLVAVADSFGFVGIVLDIARFLGFMSVVVAAFGWGVLRWASPEWKVISEQNKSDSDLAIKLAELDSQYAMSDEMIKLRMLAAYQKARGNALAAVTAAQAQHLLESGKPDDTATGLFQKPATVAGDDVQTMADDSPVEVAAPAAKRGRPKKS